MTHDEIIALLDTLSSASSQRNMGEVCPSFKVGWLESFIAGQAIQNPELRSAIKRLQTPTPTQTPTP
jgi:hypothetical protein